MTPTQKETRHGEHDVRLGSTLGLGACVLLFFAGLALNPIPRDPDVVFHPLDRVGTFLIFCSWVIAVVCWGRCLAAALRDRDGGWMHWIAYGTLGASLSAAALGLAGALGYETRWLFAGLMLFGPLLDVVLGVALRRVRNTGPRTFSAERLLGASLPPRGEPGLASWLAAVVLTVGCVLEVASRMWGAAIPHFHSDPMFYHLLGPRLWFDLGAIRFNPLHPITAQCGYWEFLAVWANQLVAGPKGAGLLDSLFFMQWASVVFGYAASGVALDRISLRLGMAAPWRRVAVFAGLTSGMMGWTAWLAKNDWGLAFWILAGFCLMLEARPRELRNFIVGGFLIGMAVANKFVIGIPLAVLLVLFAWGAGLVWPLVVVGFGMALALAPVLAHDWWALGNPVYPALNGFFQSQWVTGTMQLLLTTALHSTHFGFSRSSIERLRLLWNQDTLFLVAAAVPLVALLWAGVSRLGSGTASRKRPLAPEALDFAPLGALILVFALVGYPETRDDGTMHLRYLSFMVMLGPALGLRVIERALGRWRVGATVQLSVILLAFAVAASRFQHPLVHELFDPPTALEVSLVGGDGKRWLRQNVDPKDLVLTTGDNHLYPVGHLSVFAMTMVPYLDWIALYVTDPGEFVARLDDLGVKYVFDSKTPREGLWSPAAITLQEAIFPHPDAIVFASERSTIVDLAKLYGDIALSCRLVGISAPR